MADEKSMMPELTLDPSRTDAVPQLTLDPAAPAAPASEAAKPEATPVRMDENLLNDAEKQAVEAFSKKIDLTDSNLILQYGAAAQKNVASFSENALNSVQMGPQTRLLQNNDTLMVEKIQSSLVNTIPLWKSQMVLALGLEHGRQATAAQSAVTEMTNELLKKNADLLKMGTIETAKEAERSVVDIETLQHTNQQLISTLDEVLNIQREGAQKRRAAEAELGRIEGELKQKLLELRN